MNTGLLVTFNSHARFYWTIRCWRVAFVGRDGRLVTSVYSHPLFGRQQEISISADGIYVEVETDNTLDGAPAIVIWAA